MCELFQRESQKVHEGVTVCRGAATAGRSKQRRGAGNDRGASETLRYFSTLAEEKTLSTRDPLTFLLPTHVLFQQRPSRVH